MNTPLPPPPPFPLLEARHGAAPAPQKIYGKAPADSRQLHVVVATWMEENKKRCQTQPPTAAGGRHVAMWVVRCVWAASSCVTSRRKGICVLAKILACGIRSKPHSSAPPSCFPHPPLGHTHTRGRHAPPPTPFVAGHSQAAKTQGGASTLPLPYFHGPRSHLHWGGSRLRGGGNVLPVHGEEVDLVACPVAFRRPPWAFWSPCGCVALRQYGAMAGFFSPHEKGQATPQTPPQNVDLPDEGK